MSAGEVKSNSIKQFLLRVYSFSISSKEQINLYQKKIRDVEWSAIKPYIKKGKFIDVGYGSGYCMQKANDEFGCEVYGIDPLPVPLDWGITNYSFEIGGKYVKQASAENIPFENKLFDTVYSSHVLEHVDDELRVLKEIKRVMKDDGILIIGMPTATMAAISWITTLLFTTHIRLVNFFLSPFITSGKVSFRELFIPGSHSHHTGKTLLYDLKHYRITNWKNTLEQVFTVEKIVLPALYPYPDFIQWFKMRHSNSYSSSAFFICRKK